MWLGPVKQLLVKSVITINTSLLTKACGLHLSSLCVAHSVGFARFMTCIHYYCIVQNGFSALKIPCAPLTHPSLPPLKSLETTDLLTVSIVLPLLECHIIGFIQYVTFLCMQGARKHMLIIHKSFQSELSTLSPGFQSSQIMGRIFFLPYLARILMWLTFFKVKLLLRARRTSEVFIYCTYHRVV